jgi:hypothetical protein
MTETPRWPELREAELRQLWAAGHTSSEIGRRMHITKDAVVGKAHRLKLALQPSPIRRFEAPPGPPPLPAGHPTTWGCRGGYERRARHPT